MNTVQAERATLSPDQVARHLVDWGSHLASAGALPAWLTLPTADQADQVAAQLKALADEYRQSDLGRACQVIAVLFAFAAATTNPLHRALALRAQGNALGIGQSRYREAVAAYDEAAQIYRDERRPVEWAQAQIGKIDALASLDRYPEALAVGEQILQVFEEHEQWFFAAHVAINLAISVHERRAENQQMLAKLNQALEFYQRSGVDHAYTFATIEQDRGLVLRSLGNFAEALRACQNAWQQLTELGYTIEAARVQQNIGVTLARLGRYNEALKAIEQAHQVFLADHRPRDVADAAWLMSDCLLQLRRFQEVLVVCQRIRRTYIEIGAAFDLAQTILHEASAYIGLKNYTQAVAALHEARQIFLEVGQPVWAGRADLYDAMLLYRQQQYAQSLMLAQQASQVMRAYAHPLEEAQAQLQAAHAALALQQGPLADELVNTVLATAYQQDIPQLLYEGYSIQGQLARWHGQPEQALVAYTQAIQALERLQGHIMVEYRADFSADKTVVYAEIVQLYLAQGQTAKALDYVERAKSRALLDLVAQGLDLRIHAKAAEDQHLTEALMRLRAEQNRLYRRWEERKASQATPGLAEEQAFPTAEDWQPLWQEIRTLEQQITALWNQLLVRNAAYAQEAALWQVRSEQIQPNLDADTLLLEYFVIDNEFVLFLVTSQTIYAQNLKVNYREIESLLRFLQMNLNAVATGAPPLALQEEAQELLVELYAHLLAPVAAVLAAYPHLVIVPHGILHKLPFHALYDGRTYLSERHTIRYLPNASLLPYCRRAAQPLPACMAAATQTVVTFGHTWQGHLPAAEREAHTIAGLLGGVAYTGASATLAQFQQCAPDAALLHLATHGEFRADDPLYSYLLLADGRLTTLDIFNLRLRATLVTLSACDSGQSLVGGGDELLGLLRAFLYAGAASLVVSHWRVADQTTQQLMVLFYSQLAAGESKAAALANAQRQWLATNPTLAHPYFWAAFFLVGDGG
ncbi:MAG: CHAT domain-containing tetratricopeptide repeat protein [Caldilineaceae bacterium]